MKSLTQCRCRYTLAVRWLRLVMWSILALAVLLWCVGCTTVVRGADGKKQLSTGANASHLEFRGPGTELIVDNLDHSTPTKTAFGGAGELLMSGAAAGVLGMK